MFEVLYIIIIAVCLTIEFLRQKKGQSKCCDDLDICEPLPPGTMGIPVIGETLHFIVKKTEFFRQKRQEYGPIFKTHLLGKPTVRVSGKDNVQKIILGENKIVQSSWPSSVKKLLGPNSITISSGEQHKRKKCQLMRFLSPEFLSQHTDVFSELCTEHIKIWCSQSSVDILRNCRLLFTDLAAKYLVSMDIGVEDNVRMKELFQIFSDNLFTFPLNIPGFGFYKAYKAKAELKQIFKKIVDESGKSSRDYSTILEAYGASVDDFSEFNEDTFLDAITELLWNASETVSSTALSIIYLLAKYPEVLKKVQRELMANDFISQESRSTEKPITSVNIQNLSYIDCVVKETLRAVPTIGGTYRTVIESFKLEGYTIPRDWRLVIGIRDTHENDSYLSDPLEFNPDRWLQDQQTKNIAFLSFGGGIRACPGKNYARNVLKIFTIEVCRRCNWKLLTDNPELTLFPTPRPKDNWKVCFFSR